MSEVNVRQKEDVSVFPNVVWVKNWIEVVNNDPEIKRLAKWFSGEVMYEFGNKQYIISINSGKIQSFIEDPIWDKKWEFAIRASLETWQQSIKDVPPPFYQDIFGMMWNHGMVIDGDAIKAMQNIRALKLMLAAMKRA